MKLNNNNCTLETKTNAGCVGYDRILTVTILVTGTI